MKKLLLNSLLEENFTKTLKTLLSSSCEVSEDKLENNKDYNIILTIETIKDLKLNKGSNCFIITTNPTTTITELEVEFKNLKTMYSENDKFVHIIFDKDFLVNNTNKIYLAINSYIKRLLGVRINNHRSNSLSYIVVSWDERENILSTPLKDEAITTCDKYQNAKIIYDGQIIYRSAFNLVKVNTTPISINNNLGKNKKKSGYQISQKKYRKIF